ncbi:MAG TPA: hypothetical protein VFF73_14960 [Planctomycetota bacterium]|nr:hypothetical protein [Planctomycetota bacterium]
MSRNNLSRSSSPKALATRIENLIGGFSKLSPSEQFDVLGTVSGPPSLVTELQGHLAPITGADDAELAAKKARQSRDAAHPNTIARVEAIEEAVRSHFGSKSSDLTNFGLAPRKKPTKPSPAKRAASAAKAKATRAARKAALKAIATPPPLPPTK